MPTGADDPTRGSVLCGGAVWRSWGREVSAQSEPRAVKSEARRKWCHLLSDGQFRPRSSYPHRPSSGTQFPNFASVPRTGLPTPPLPAVALEWPTGASEGAASCERWLRLTSHWPLHFHLPPVVSTRLPRGSSARPDRSRSASPRGHNPGVPPLRRVRADRTPGTARRTVAQLESRTKRVEVWYRSGDRRGPHRQTW